MKSNNAHNSIELTSSSLFHQHQDSIDMGDDSKSGSHQVVAAFRNPSAGDDDDESKAQVDIWKYVFGFTEMAVIKCAIELGIADLLETHPSRTMSLDELSAALGCSPPYLHRIMRFLIHRNIFKELTPSIYTQTPLSRLFARNVEKNMTAFLLLESSHVMLKPWHGLSDRVLGNGPPAFEAAHGDDVWRFAEANPAHSKLINDAMACDARVTVPAIIEGCPEVFTGIRTLVDVGGGDGTALRILVKGFPWIHGINFDVPHVVSDNASLEYSEGVEHVAGDMFVNVPKADAVFIKWVLHDWGDEECIQILKKCREAIPQDKGKVIIVEAVIAGGDGGGEGKEHNDKLEDVGLMLDMVMMAHTSKGKERTWEEWVYVLNEAGFRTYSVKPIQAVQSVIVAYP